MVEIADMIIREQSNNVTGGTFTVSRDSVESLPLRHDATEADVNTAFLWLARVIEVRDEALRIERKRVAAKRLRVLITITIICVVLAAIILAVSR